MGGTFLIVLIVAVVDVLGGILGWHCAKFPIGIRIVYNFLQFRFQTSNSEIDVPPVDNIGPPMYTCKRKLDPFEFVSYTNHGEYGERCLETQRVAPSPATVGERYGTVDELLQNRGDVFGKDTIAPATES